VRNVEVSDATLVLVCGETSSPGTALTCRTAEARGARWAVIDLNAPGRDAQLAAFVATLPRACTLNVAGPRESEQPGISAAVTSFLLEHRGLLFGS
jgi:Circularly permutated YpsA SLOG family